MVFLYRFLFYIVGLFIITLGASITIKMDLGAGAWDALNVGLSHTFGFTIGTWVIIVQSILILVNAVILKSRPQFLSLFTVFLVGFLIDFWMLFILKEWFVTGFVLRLILLIIGLGIIGLGAAIYLQANFPSIPIDTFMLAIKERLKLNLMNAKTVSEIIALVLAFIFSGPIGLGTFIITIAIGPFIQLFFPFSEKLLKRLTFKYQ